MKTSSSSTVTATITTTDSTAITAMIIIHINEKNVEKNSDSLHFILILISQRDFRKKIGSKTKKKSTNNHLLELSISM